ncbi:MAG: TonB-dependent receptor [Tannerella sp.]|jgi:outer membrane receptor for ferrienterochelin and colicins|nr:TonB-dependent receptor [Tannerella sp.]
MKKYIVLTAFLLSAACNAFSQSSDARASADSVRPLGIDERTHFLDEVVVTGTLTSRTLKNTPVLTRVIPGADIRRSGAVTALEALENFVPGVHFTPNPMGDNIQIAGLDNKYILVLVDGERLVNERTENVNFSRLNASDIKRIEIINGASSVLYGSNAIGAVINIITADVDKPLLGSVRVRYSKYNSFVADATFGFRIKGFSSKTTLSAKNSDGYTARSQPGEDGQTTQYTMYPYSDLSLSRVFKYETTRLTAELKGAYYRNEQWFLHKYQTRVDVNHTLGAKVRYTPPSAAHTLTLSGNSDNYGGHQVYKMRRDSSVYVNGSRYTAFRLIDAWDVTDKIQLVSGAEMNLEHTFSYNQFGFDPAKRRASNANVFAQGEFRTDNGLEALAGARYTHHSQFGGYLSPKISLMYRTGGFRFRGNISNGYKAPTLKELYMNFPHKIGEDIPFWIIGNDALVPEESWYRAVSVEYIAPGINASVTAHDNSIRNKINTTQFWDEALSRTEMKYENVEDARITGVDCALQWDFLKRFHLRSGYSFAHAVDVATGRQLSGNSKHTATLSLMFGNARLPFLPSSDSPYTLSLLARFMSPRNFYSVDLITGEVNDDSTGSYFISNFVYSQQFALHKDLKAEFQFGINNLFNHVNRDFLSNNPGRIFFVASGIRF